MEKLPNAGDPASENFLKGPEVGEQIPDVHLAQPVWKPRLLPAGRHEQGPHPVPSKRLLVTTLKNSARGAVGKPGDSRRKPHLGLRDQLRFS